MNSFVDHLFAIFIRLSGFGLFVLGVLDDSFLFVPLGIDLLMVALTVRNHKMLPIFITTATAGSVLGCLLIDLVARKGGKEGLARLVSGRQLNYIKRKVDSSAGWAIAVACVMPPPFPFTGIIIGAAGFQYPRNKLLIIVAIARMFRFLVLGVLALTFGERIVHLAETPGVRIAILILVAVSIVGSTVSIVSWVNRARNARS